MAYNWQFSSQLWSRIRRKRKSIRRGGEGGKDGWMMKARNCNLLLRNLLLIGILMQGPKQKYREQKASRSAE